MNQINHTDLESKICGTYNIDLNLLKKYTVFPKGIYNHNSPVIKFLWEVL